MTYNLTLLENNTNLYLVVRSANDLSSGTFATFFLIIIWFVLVIAFKNYDTKAGLLASSFITSFVGMLFWGLGQVSLQVGSVCITGLLLCMVAFYFRD